MDTKTVRERKRLSDVKEVGEAPPEGLQLSSSIFQGCGESRLHAQLSHKLLSRQPRECEEMLFYIWRCISIFFSPAQPSSRLCSTFTAHPLCNYLVQPFRSSLFALLNACLFIPLYSSLLSISVNSFSIKSQNLI